MSGLALDYNNLTQPSDAFPLAVEQPNMHMCSVFSPKRMPPLVTTTQVRKTYAVSFAWNAGGELPSSTSDVSYVCESRILVSNCEISLWI